MADNTVPVCACPHCRSGHDHPERQLHHQINLLTSRLDEQQRRWFAALESKKAGYGGDTLFGLGVMVGDAEMAELNIEQHDTCPQWNYTIEPRDAQGWNW